jgi:hypothetical protein
MIVPICLIVCVNAIVWFCNNHTVCTLHTTRVALSVMCIHNEGTEQSWLEEIPVLYLFDSLFLWFLGYCFVELWLIALLSSYTGVEVQNCVCVRAVSD